MALLTPERYVIHVLKLVCCGGWFLIWIIKFMYRDVLWKPKGGRVVMFFLEIVLIGLALASFAMVTRMQISLDREDKSTINYHKETSMG